MMGTALLLRIKLLQMNIKLCTLAKDSPWSLSHISRVLRNERTSQPVIDFVAKYVRDREQQAA